ncbi:MAG: serine protease [Ignavibacteriales bacterium]|nr:serine protease [Ignavibacteriales bacterium]
MNSSYCRVACLLCVLLCSWVMGCSSTPPQFDDQQNRFHSPYVQQNLRAVVPSVVGVGASFKYRVELYRYEMVNGKAMSDTNSPTGYRLLRGTAGLSVISRTSDTRGCGLILQSDDRNCLVLTSQHILSLPDTMIDFFRDDYGKLTDRLSYRAIKEYTSYYVIDLTNKFDPASVVVADVRSDLALVRVDPTQALNSEFPFGFTFQRELTWGDPVYVFGFPQSMKQLTTAVVSPAPYAGYFAVDAVSRHGYSGGPVLYVRPNGELELAGIIRSVPASKLRYILPPPDLPMGGSLTVEDLRNSIVAEDDLIEYGSAYVVGMEKIGKFLQESVPQLRRQGISLSRRLLPFIVE